MILMNYLYKIIKLPGKIQINKRNLEPAPVIILMYGLPAWPENYSDPALSDLRNP